MGIENKITPGFAWFVALTTKAGLLLLFEGTGLMNIEFAC